MSETDPLPLLSAHEQNPVPVFSCHVIISRPDQSGRITARVANLGEVTSEGGSEREVLTAIVKEFKRAVQGYVEKQEKVPFSSTAEAPAEGELERFIPVHL